MPHFETKMITQFFIELIAIINTISSAAIFLSMTEYATPKMRMKIALACTISVFFVLFFTGLLGLGMLNFFGISMGALRFAGGIVVFMIGYKMLIGHPTKNNIEKKDNLTTALGIIPLAILLSSGA